MGRPNGPNVRFGTFGTKTYHLPQVGSMVRSRASIHLLGETGHVPRLTDRRIDRRLAHITAERLSVRSNSLLEFLENSWGLEFTLDFRVNFIDAPKFVL